MIIPNLMVRDLPRSVAFYRDILGLKLALTVTAEHETKFGNEAATEDAVFAILELQASQLMLQTVSSLAEELEVFSPQSAPTASGTVYIRGFAPESALAKLTPEQIVKGPQTSWYGVRELYVRDPDGYVICLGVPDGASVPEPG